MRDSTMSATRPRSSITALLEGLFYDLKALAIQEFRLATHEFQEELGKAKMAAAFIAVGGVLGAVGSLLLILMLVHLLAAAGLPLWASYGLVGLLTCAAGVALFLKAKAQVSDIHLMPIRTVHTMKENVSWMKEEVTSGRM